MSEEAYQERLKETPPQSSPDFIEYLKKNNPVELENDWWLVIHNCKYDGKTEHLTMFSKENVQEPGKLSPMALCSMALIFSGSRDKLIWLNPVKGRSVPGRLHFHIADVFI